MAPPALPVPLTSFVARRRELAELYGAVSHARLVTVTGPGGVGKTRLALAAAEQVRDRTSGGSPAAWPVAWASLAALSDPELVPHAVAEACAVPEAPGRKLEDSVAEQLGDGPLLLVMDGCEQLLDTAAPLLERLLARCPELRVLATSREVLGATGEVVRPVPSLAVPEEADLSPDQLAEYDAVRLFVERARAGVPAFAVTAENAAAVAQTCRRLDGLPLALELAAARVRVLGVEQVAARLDDCFRLLVGGSRSLLPRQRTLRSTLDWSHDLLDAPEAVLFRRLSVFPSDIPLEAAEELCSGDGLEPEDVLDLLARLTEKSLLVPRPREDGVRHRMLATVRLYARERLLAAGEDDRLRRRHAGRLLHLAERAEPELTGPAQARWLTRLEEELPDLRAAMDCFRDTGGVDGQVRLAGALWRFCYLRGHYGQGRAWLEHALEQAADHPRGTSTAAREAAQAKALTGAGVLAFLQCDYALAVRRLEEGLRRYRDSGDRHAEAESLQVLAGVAREQGRYEQATTLLEESLTLWDGVADDVAGWGAARSLNYLGFLAWLQGDWDRADELCARALDRFQQLADTEGVVWSLTSLGAVAQYRGDTQQAEALLDDARRLAQQAGYREGVAWTLDQLGRVAARRGQPERAAELLRASLAGHRDLGDRWRMASVLEALAGALAETRPAGHGGDGDRLASAVRTLAAADLLRAAIGSPRPPCEEPTHGRAVATLRERLAPSAYDAAWRRGRAVPLAEAVAAVLARDAPPASPAAPAPTAAAATAAPMTGGMPGLVPAGELLVVRALGGAGVELAGRALGTEDWRYAKPHELLHYLLASPPRSKEQIGADLWPEATTAQLRNSLHAALHALRRALGPTDWVTYAGGRYAFDRSPGCWYDVDAFTRAATGAPRVEDPAAVSRLRRAVDLYRGDLLADLAAGDWVVEHRAALRRRYEQVLRNLGRLLVRSGSTGEAIDAYLLLVRADPLSEAAYRALMRCYARLGERGQVRRQYEMLTATLAQELGASPAPETRALYDQLRHGTAP